MITNCVTLLSIECFEFTGIEIGKLKKNYINKEHFYEYVLPKYSLSEKGYIRHSYYNHYIEDGDEIYRFFKAETIDKLLGEEISNGGLEDLIKKVNLNQMFDILHVKKLDDFNRGYPVAEYMVIELHYSSSFNGESTEYDMDVEVSGFLKGTHFIKYKKPKMGKIDLIPF